MDNKNLNDYVNKMNEVASGLSELSGMNPVDACKCLADQCGWKIIETLGPGGDGHIVHLLQRDDDQIALWESGVYGNEKIAVGQVGFDEDTSPFDRDPDVGMF